MVKQISAESLLAIGIQIYNILVLLRIQFCFVSFKDRIVRCVVWCDVVAILKFIYTNTHIQKQTPK